jgi:hypothetical protein
MITLTEFSNAWNDLRNAVMGRGVSKPPNISQQLYDSVGNYYERFRTWLQQQGPITEITTAIGATEQMTTYRQLANQAKKEGAVFNALDIGLAEIAKGAALSAQRPDVLKAAIAGTAFVLVIPALLAFLGSAMGRSNR